MEWFKNGIWKIVKEICGFILLFVSIFFWISSKRLNNFLVVEIVIGFDGMNCMYGLCVDFFFYVFYVFMFLMFFMLLFI